MTTGVFRKAYHAILLIDRFIRLHFVGFVVVWSLLGGWSTDNGLETGDAFKIILIAFLFHVFAYVLNDVIDLPVDRTNPSRQLDPMVRGIISPRSALVVALATIPISFILLSLFAVPAYTQFALFAAFMCMGIYDVWGKRSFCPPVTDIAQGLGWGAMAYVGAGITELPPTVTTHILFAYALFHIFLINGIHGGIRDLENDLSAGRITTAAYLGMKPGYCKVKPFPAVIVFTLALQLILVGLLVFPIWENYYGYSQVQQVLASILAAVLSLTLLVLAYRVARPDLRGWYWAMRIHLYLIPLALILNFLPVVGIGFGVLLVAFYTLPGLTLEFTWRLIGRIFGKEKIYDERIAWGSKERESYSSTEH